MNYVIRKKMDAVDFVSELDGVISEEQAKVIYRNIEHYSDMVKNVVIDLLRANPRKYVPILLGDDR